MEDENLHLAMDFPGDEKASREAAKGAKMMGRSINSNVAYYRNSKLMLHGNREDCATLLSNGKVQQ